MESTPASDLGPMPALQGISDPSAVRIVASAADLALVLDQDGVIIDLWLGAGFEGQPGWEQLVGQRWTETVRQDSQTKVERLLGDAHGQQTARSREINQKVEGVGEVPIRFSGALVDDEHVLAIGQDLRPLAELQQRMVSAQQAMDLEYRRLRQADTRYRVLFHVCSEGVLVAKGDDRTVIEANPAATSLLGEPADALQGRALQDMVAAESRDELLTLLGAVEVGAQPVVELRLRGPDQTEVKASASTFRQAGSVLVLFRFWRSGMGATPSARDARMLQVLEALPDGFIVTGEDQRILSANAGFCELVQRADETQVIGRRLDRWVGRPGVDLNIILANLREHGVVREFATIVRGDFDSEQEALVTAVSATDGKVPCLGFTIRPVSSRLAEAPTGAGTTTFLPRSIDQLRSLVGRVPLKEIVRESADLIERLCIGAALDVSSNNRAAAAQLLGLSRQSLYSKMRRHGLGEFQPS